MASLWREYEERHRQGEEEAGHKQLCVEEVQARQQIGHHDLLAEDEMDEEGGDCNCKQGEEDGVHPEVGTEAGTLVLPHTFIQSDLKIILANFKTILPFLSSTEDVCGSWLQSAFI